MMQAKEAIKKGKVTSRCKNEFLTKSYSLVKHFDVFELFFVKLGIGATWN